MDVLKRSMPFGVLRIKLIGPLKGCCFSEEAGGNSVSSKKTRGAHLARVTFKAKVAEARCKEVYQTNKETNKQTNGLTNINQNKPKRTKAEKIITIHFVNSISLSSSDFQSNPKKLPLKEVLAWLWVQPSGMLHIQNSQWLSRLCIRHTLQRDEASKPRLCSLHI